MGLRKFCICDCIFCVNCGGILPVDPLVDVLSLYVKVGQDSSCVLELFCCGVRLWGRGFWVDVGG